MDLETLTLGWLNESRDKVYGTGANDNGQDFTKKLLASAQSARHVRMLRTRKGGSHDRLH